jgi:hypothetical protein
VAKKVWTQKRKKPKAKTKRAKIGVKVARKKFAKKMNIVVESYLNSNSEISLPP